MPNHLFACYFSEVSSFFDNLKSKFEFLSSPKMNINSTNVTLALIVDAKDVYSAEKFCSAYSNGKLYDLESGYNEVVSFAKKFGVHTFYTSLSDKSIENNFTYPDGKLFELDIPWNDGEPNNEIPKTHHFCEGLYLVLFMEKQPTS